MTATASPRRWFIRSVVVGGLASTVLSEEKASAATWQPGRRAAHDVRVGDMIGGPDGSIVRVESVAKVGPRVRIRYTNPVVGATQPLRFGNDRVGFSPGQQLVVYARGIPASAVQVGLVAAPTRVVDGGAP